MTKPFTFENIDETIFFKNISEYYIYVLVFTDGKQRTRKLKIFPMHYRDMESANIWYKNIIDTISEYPHPYRYEAINNLNKIYLNMTDYK